MEQKSLFDIKDVPFSFFGSWMTISLMDETPQLYLRNVHNGSHKLFRIMPVIDGQKLNYSVAATPTLLTLTVPDKGRIEFCFEGRDSIRVKGCGISLDMECVLSVIAYSEKPQYSTFNFRPALRRYQIETLSGKSNMRGKYVKGNRETPGFMISPDENGLWEIAIDEFWSSWKSPLRKGFKECCAESLNNFEDFVSSMPTAPSELKDPHCLASYINWSCTVAPAGFLERNTLLMSKNWMTSVWSWDQCFNAMALTGGQDRLAMDQMLLLVDKQDEFGCYPDAQNDFLIHYNYSKPPVHGWAFENILETLSEKPDQETMSVMYESLSKQVDWWMTYRRKEDSELPYYLHGNDSGWDNSTMFDKGVPLETPDLAALLVIQMDVLSKICTEAGKPDDKEMWKKRADKLFNALMDNLWQIDNFVALLANDHSIVEHRSLIPSLAIILGLRLPKEVRECLIKQIESHLTEWGLATEHPESPEYESDGYWRGPIWAPSSYIAVCGLERSGYPELAKKIAERFCKLCAKSGFAENFDAITGESLRDPAYTWTASVFLLMLKRI